MHGLSRFFTLFFIGLCVSCTAVSAQSWRYAEERNRNGDYVVIFQETASIVYISNDDRWALNLSLLDISSVRDAKLRFIFGDGSRQTFSVSNDHVTVTPNENSNATLVALPLTNDILELLQAASVLNFVFDNRNFEFPLTGTRAAVIEAADAALYDSAQEDDRQHQIAQQASDEAQAATREMAVQDCDRLTAHSWDQDAQSAGVAWDELDGPSAVSACEHAINLNGNIPRIVYQLGRAYDKTGRDIAFDLIEFAAWDLEYPAAFYHLGTLHEDGLFTDKNQDLAERSYLEGASYGHIPSIYSLGKIRFETAQSDQERDDALGLLFDASAAQYPHAFEHLGFMILDGRVPSLETSLAVTYLKGASDMGLPDASYRLSTMYRDGEGVEVDAPTAFQYLVRASRQGHAQATNDLEF